MAFNETRPPSLPAAPGGNGQNRGSAGEWCSGGTAEPRLGGHAWFSRCPSFGERSGNAGALVAVPASRSPSVQPPGRGPRRPAPRRGRSAQPSPGRAGAHPALSGRLAWVGSPGWCSLLLAPPRQVLGARHPPPRRSLPSPAPTGPTPTEERAAVGRAGRLPPAPSPAPGTQRLRPRRGAWRADSARLRWAARHGPGPARFPAAQPLAAPG